MLRQRELVDGFLDSTERNPNRKGLSTCRLGQQLLNDGRIGQEVTSSMLDALLDAGIISTQLTPVDFALLRNSNLNVGARLLDGAITLDGCTFQPISRKRTRRTKSSSVASVQN